MGAFIDNVIQIVGGIGFIMMLGQEGNYLKWSVRKVKTTGVMLMILALVAGAVRYTFFEVTEHFNGNALVAMLMLIGLYCLVNYANPAKGNEVVWAANPDGWLRPFGSERLFIPPIYYWPIKTTRGAHRKHVVVESKTRDSMPVRWESELYLFPLEHCPPGTKVGTEGLDQELYDAIKMALGRCESASVDISEKLVLAHVKNALGNHGYKCSVPDNKRFLHVQGLR